VSYPNVVTSSEQRCCLNAFVAAFVLLMDCGHLFCSGQVLSSRSHPEWSLKRLGDLLYGQAGVPRESWVAWSGTEEERQTLIDMPELAIHEWKDALLDPDIEMTRDY
jgi:hypothetical protein